MSQPKCGRCGDGYWPHADAENGPSPADAEQSGMCKTCEIMVSHAANEAEQLPRLASASNEDRLVFCLRVRSAGWIDEVVLHVDVPRHRREQVEAALAAGGALILRRDVHEPMKGFRAFDEAGSILPTFEEEVPR